MVPPEWHVLVRNNEAIQIAQNHQDLLPNFKDGDKILQYHNGKWEKLTLAYQITPDGMIHNVHHNP